MADKDQIIRFTSDGIYVNKDGPYDEDAPEYAYLNPTEDDTAPYSIVDCWICDRKGNIHPGYNVSAVPIHTSSIGGMVRHIEREDY